jgi:hypothetical protein
MEPLPLRGVDPPPLPNRSPVSAAAPFRTDPTQLHKLSCHFVLTAGFFLAIEWFMPYDFMNYQQSTAAWGWQSARFPRVKPQGPFYACNHTRTHHVLFVYIPDGIPHEPDRGERIWLELARGRLTEQALDAMTYRAERNPALAWPWWENLVGIGTWPTDWAGFRCNDVSSLVSRLQLGYDCHWCKRPVTWRSPTLIYTPFSVVSRARKALRVSTTAKIAQMPSKEGAVLSTRKFHQGHHWHQTHMHNCRINEITNKLEQ